MKCYNFVLTFIILVVFNHCNSQTSKPEKKLKNRKAYVSGQFYPADKDELMLDLKHNFDSVSSEKHSNVIAIISPHAGYIFSGKIAATAFSQIDGEKEYDNIFVIASSHSVAIDGASIYYSGNYETPLGEVEVNKELGEMLTKKFKIFVDDESPHLREHSLEVQLPFLQYVMKKKFKIIPIIVGTDAPEDCKEIADALKPYFNSSNLFIISTDFSHYPKYEDAKKVDKKTVEAITSNNSKKLIDYLFNTEQYNVKNLATRLCGWTSVLSLIYMTENDNSITYYPVEYQNSGDVYNDKNRVVGYWSVAVGINKNENEFFLTEKDKSDLLAIARNTLESYININKKPTYSTEYYSDALKKKCGAFVTLTIHEKLRGCIGRFEVDEPLYKVVSEMAISSSTQDPRFKSVEPNELKDIKIEISVLTPMHKIKSIDEIVLGKHGIYIKKGYRSGTFLPQVANETNWTKEEFLGHCSADKAGIGWDGWKEADIYIYEALVFSEDK